MTAAVKSPFPKLSQAWRAIRVGGWSFATAAVSGLAHLAWSDRTMIAAAAAGVLEVAYRQAVPAGALSGKLASLLAAYRQITAAAKAADPVPAAAEAKPEPAPAPAPAPMPAPEAPPATA